MEMAKQGWGNDSSDSDLDEEHLRPENGSDDDDDGLSLQKMGEKLLKAAQETRVRYRHPRIRFVLPKVHYGKITQVDAIVDGLRKDGITVQCASDVPPAVPIEKALDTMILDELADLSPTLNLDCTILLALISDISHGQVTEQPWFNRAVRRQIEIEAKERLMCETLWPVMDNRSLTCTSPAAKRMREITELIGTETEKARMRILMGDETTKTQADLIADFQSYSEYPIPATWKLPITVADTDIPSLLQSDELPRVAAAVAEQLSAINQSVFLYGWAHGWSTVTSNRTVSKQIETLVEANRNGEEEVGPDVWLCPTSRSLVAKERDRKGQ